MPDSTTPDTDAGERILRVAVCYDGGWWQNLARYVRHWRPGKQVNLAGYHDVLRWHIAGLSRYPVERVAVREAHYIAGATPPIPWASELASLGVVRHVVPVTRQKGQIGADVELALTCYQAAHEQRADVVVLMSGDSDLGPLAARIRELGLELVVPVATAEFPAATGMVTCRTSGLLVRHASSAPQFTDLIAAGQAPDYPPGLIPPLADWHDAAERRNDIVTSWHHTMDYCFITADDGQLWYAGAYDMAAAPACAGEPVSFTGDAVTPAGKSYPRARDVRVRTDNGVTRWATFDQA